MDGFVCMDGLFSSLILGRCCGAGKLGVAESCHGFYVEGEV